jgi:hypothetical protein
MTDYGSMERGAELMKAMWAAPTPYDNSKVYANRIYEKLNALGLEIREKGQ